MLSELTYKLGRQEEGERERTTGSARTTPGVTWPSPGLCSKVIAGWTLCSYLSCGGEAMWLKPRAGLTGPRKAQCAEGQEAPRA